MYDLMESSLTFDQLLEAVREKRSPVSSEPADVRKVAHDETEEFYTALLYRGGTLHPATYAGKKPTALNIITKEDVSYEGRNMKQLKASFILREPVIVVENYLTKHGEMKYRLTICHPEWQVDGDPELSMEKIIWKLQQRELVQT